MLSSMPKIVKAFPPNYVELTKRFPIKGMQGIVFAYGDRIYNPGGRELMPWVKEHEWVHCLRQRGMEVEAWWYEYIRNNDFRLHEEVLAHRREWEIAQDMLSPRDKMHYLDMMADRLSGKLYGELVTHKEAVALITEEQ